MKAAMVKSLKKRYAVWMMVLAILVGTAFLTGCGSSEEGADFFKTGSFPDFKDLMVEESGSGDSVSGNVIPVRIYFDNTGSMEGFTKDEKEKRNPCASYVKLIRCLRDMGRMQEAEYYVLDENKQDWTLYEESLYDNFCTSGFHVGWAPEQPGPLSKLYMDNRIDENYINVVLTDLAEQNLNNTQLAEQIRKMCMEKGCEADLFAFKFDFNGPAQVPNPGATAGMLNEDVHGEKPYYMIVTGRADYMEKYRKELKTLLADAGLSEGEDYYTATSQTSIVYDSIDLSDVVFEPFADFDQIFQENEEQKKKEKENIEKDKEEAENNGDEAAKEEMGKNIVSLSKNLQRYDDTNQIFPDLEFAAFYYQKVEGVSKEQGDWRLNFYVPLKDFKNPQIKYTYQCHVYKLEQPLTEAEIETEALDSGQEPVADGREWVEDTNPEIKLSMEVLEDFEGTEGYCPAALYVSCQDIQDMRAEEKNGLKEQGLFLIFGGIARYYSEALYASGQDIQDMSAESKYEPGEQELLLILKIEKEEVYPYERPKWLDLFDTGDTDDYFTRTFNLYSFYDVLFGNINRVDGDGKIHNDSNYAQIPVILAGLKK